MAEIKTAVEIAMERTRSLRLSSEEKERLKQEELLSRGHALVNRFLEIDLHFREVAKELAKYSIPERSQMEKIMLEDFAGTLDLDRNNDLIFQGIETLAPEKKEALRQAAEWMKEYRSQREKERQRVAEALRDQLKNIGLSGSAVLPKVEGSGEWVQASASFRKPYEAKLANLQEELRR